MSSHYPLDHGRGYFVLPRSLEDLEPLCRKPLALAVYTILGCRARSVAGWAHGSHGAERLERGECLAGESELAKKTGSNASAVRRALGLLEKLGLIERKAKKRGSIVTIRRYGDFGDSAEESEEAAKKPRSSDEEAAKEQRSSDEEAAKSKERITDNGKRENGIGARKRAHALPDSWKPTDRHRAKADESRLDLEAEAESFKDHHIAKGSVMKDWDRAFNTWLRNAVRFAAERQPSQPTRAPERML